MLSFYEKNADQYVAFERLIEKDPKKFPLLVKLRQREQDLLRQCRGHKTFYFATGSGTNALTLVRSGAHVVTLDFSAAMISKAKDWFDEKGVTYRIISHNYFSQDTLDNHLESEPNKVLVINGDFRETTFPDGYFDDVFCYCTLPLLGERWEESLGKLLSISKSGAVSVYDYEQRETLREYYARAGFNSYVEGKIVFKEGGFAYECLDPEKMKALICPKKKLVIEQVGLGKIYRWTETKPVGGESN